MNIVDLISEVTGHNAITSILSEFPNGEYIIKYDCIMCNKELHIVRRISKTLFSNLYNHFKYENDLYFIRDFINNKYIEHYNLNELITCKEQQIKKYFRVKNI